jgi:hypothetical protein
MRGEEMHRFAAVGFVGQIGTFGRGFGSGRFFGCRRCFFRNIRRSAAVASAGGSGQQKREQQKSCRYLSDIYFIAPISTFCLNLCFTEAL